MTITRISILRQPSGTDTVYVYTDLPSPFPYDPSHPHSMKFECTKGTAEAYVKTHFPGIPIEFIDAP